MKFVVRLNSKTLTYDTFFYNDPGPLPPIIDPPEPDEPKDTGPQVKDIPVPVNNPEPKERNLNKPKPS